jgi:hypothetical protein
MDLTGDLLSALLVWLLPAMLVTWIAIGKGLSGVGFAFAAVICWPLALLVVVVTPRQRA